MRRSSRRGDPSGPRAGVGGRHGATLAVTACERIFDRPIGGVWASDHFGVMADLAVAPRPHLDPADGSSG